MVQNKKNVINSINYLWRLSMLRFLLFLLVPFFLLAAIEDEIICEVNNDSLPQVTQMMDTHLKVGLLLVQFADAETNPINYDAKGGVGYDIDGNLVDNKYHYEDYWNIFFSFGTYHDLDPEQFPLLHPDAESHRTGVYGSFKDYWWEVSHKNLTIKAPVTRNTPTGDPMKDKGIINKINADGTIQWITLAKRKDEYSANNKGRQALIKDIIAKASDPSLEIDFTDESEFDKVLFMFAGTNTFGASTVDRINGRYSLSEERMEYGRTAHLAGFGLHAHEFGHLIGFSDLYGTDTDESNGVGIFSLMALGANFGTNQIGRFLPSHLGPRDKLKKGWLDYDFITSDKTGYQLTPVSDNIADLLPRVAIIVNEGDPENNNWEKSDYIILENRSAIGFDRRLTKGNPGFNGGMIVWHSSNKNLQNSETIQIVEADATAEANWPGDAGIPHTINDIGGPSDFFPGSLDIQLINDITTPALPISDNNVAHVQISNIEYIESDNGNTNNFVRLDIDREWAPGIHEIDGHETISGDISKDIIVRSNGILELAPGANTIKDVRDRIKITFEAGSQFIANGIAGAPVTLAFENNNSDKNWFGLEFEAGSDFDISYLSIKDADIAIDAPTLVVNDKTITGLYIEDCNEGVIFETGSNLTYTNCTFKNIDINQNLSGNINNSTFEGTTINVNVNNGFDINSSSFQNSTIDYGTADLSVKLQNSSLNNSTIKLDDHSSTEITNNNFLNGSTIIVKNYSNPLIEDNIFIGNGSGTAIKMGVPASSGKPGHPSTIAENNSAPTIVNNTISNYSLGVAIYNETPDNSDCVLKFV